MRLENKVAIITGGASGIGLAACERFLEAGAKVILADFNEEEGRKQAEVLQSKGEIYFVQVDVAEQTSIQQLVKKTVELFRKIDILINNAGITNDATLLKMKSEQFQKC